MFPKNTTTVESTTRDPKSIMDLTTTSTTTLASTKLTTTVITSSSPTTTTLSTTVTTTATTTTTKTTTITTTTAATSKKLPLCTPQATFRDYEVNCLPICTDDVIIVKSNEEPTCIPICSGIENPLDIECLEKCETFEERSDDYGFVPKQISSGDCVPQCPLEDTEFLAAGINCYLPKLPEEETCDPLPLCTPQATFKDYGATCLPICTDDVIIVKSNEEPTCIPLCSNIENSREVRCLNKCPSEDESKDYGFQPKQLPSFKCVSKCPIEDDEFLAVGVNCYLQETEITTPVPFLPDYDEVTYDYSYPDQRYLVESSKGNL